MKKVSGALALFTITVGVLFTGCSSSSEKVDKAEMKVEEANKDLDEANEAYLADVAEFKMQTAKKLEANRKLINDYNIRISTEKKEAKSGYEMKIAELEAKNSEMQKRLDNHTADGKDNWENFKTEFGRDMDNLGNAFTNFFN
ncbi:MAG TPA: hypothetical protein DHW15_11675 [Bacteroidetes bacterium]|jgi:hypothetical protein|nr:MAG: hypothetical protein ABR95_06660 [Sphingobacteriales bacterium BACL12 MAG-120813-bin55]HCK22783.1 hypothetical protein [Bacteroidota bacterium]